MGSLELSPSLTVHPLTNSPPSHLQSTLSLTVHPLTYTPATALSLRVHSIAAKLLKSFGRAVKHLKKKGKGGKKKCIQI